MDRGSGKMPRPKKLSDRFHPAQAANITGLSTHMLYYLSRQGYLVPAYSKEGRGNTRYYSYRDLVVARIVFKLLQSGLEISRLKDGIRKLSDDRLWRSSTKGQAIRMLATDGRNVFFPQENGTLVDLTQGGQLTFAFVLDIAAATAEVQSSLSPEELKRFTFKNQRRA
jgi:DNA-binding transcriptional MerR regulator